MQRQRLLVWRPRGSSKRQVVVGELFRGSRPLEGGAFRARPLIAAQIQPESAGQVDINYEYSFTGPCIAAVRTQSWRRLNLAILATDPTLVDYGSLTP